MNKKGKILFFCMIFVAATFFSHGQAIKPGRVFLLQTATNKPVHTIKLVKAKEYLPPLTPVITSDFYVSRLGFFCKQEIKLEKFTKIPFRFRLGNIEDCDRLEGKQKSIFPRK